jgi:hypothetical protein
LLFCFGRERISPGSVGNPQPSRKTSDGLLSLEDAPRDMQITLDVDLFRTIFRPQYLDARRHRTVGFGSQIQFLLAVDSSPKGRIEGNLPVEKSNFHPFTQHTID